MSQLNIVQIGSSVAGDSASEFFEFYQEHINKALLIDASPASVQATKDYYLSNLPHSVSVERMEYLNYAIVTDPSTTEIELFYPEGDPLSGFNSIFKSHVDSHRAGHGQQAVSINVPAITLNKLLKDYQIKEIDRLYIDAEGMDADILLSLDLSAFTIPYIAFEHGHTDGSFTKGAKWKDLLDYFHRQNYQPFLVFTHDLQLDYSAWAIHKDFLSFFNIGLPLLNPSGVAADLNGVPILDAREPASASKTVFRTEAGNFQMEEYLKVK